MCFAFSFGISFALLNTSVAIPKPDVFSIVDCPSGGCITVLGNYRGTPARPRALGPHHCRFFDRNIGHLIMVDLCGRQLIRRLLGNFFAVISASSFALMLVMARKLNAKQTY